MAEVAAVEAAVAQPRLLMIRVKRKRGSEAPEDLGERRLLSRRRRRRRLPTACRLVTLAASSD